MAVHGHARPCGVRHGSVWPTWFGLTRVGLSWPGGADEARPRWALPRGVRHGFGCDRFRERRNSGVAPFFLGEIVTTTGLYCRQCARELSNQWSEYGGAHDPEKHINAMAYDVTPTGRVVDNAREFQCRRGHIFLIGVANGETTTT